MEPSGVKDNHANSTNYGNGVKSQQQVLSNALPNTQVAANPFMNGDERETG